MSQFDDNPPPPPKLEQGEGAAKDKTTAGILGILLGGLGVHKFYLGYTNEGLIMLLVSLIGGVFTCGFGSMAVGAIGLAEGIIYITKSDEEFAATYVHGRKTWF